MNNNSLYRKSLNAIFLILILLIVIFFQEKKVLTPQTADLSDQIISSSTQLNP
ncbi:MAG TPA: hypothetical protein VJH70_02690 [Candidatus Paceibacterota bacterium]